ncbi:MAG TPA: hypothetical protein VNA28_04665 [Solirubrobacteraceae bacterium]|nr:hypothetical protein [Solirubrobacteraceae bacterium]
MPHRLCRRAGAAVLAALAVLAVGASTASAGVLVASAPSCDDQSLSKPFAPWLDYADYTPLPGGNFEGDMSNWSLSGGAAVANGNAPQHVGGADDASSLALPAGGSATSATLCVGLTHPTVRFFAKRRSGMLSTLKVDVMFELFDGSVVTLPIGAVANGGNWQPTLPMLVVANLLPLLPGEHTPVAFRFTATGGNWSVDDVYVDPYYRK